MGGIETFTNKQTLYGIVGHPVKKSLSPVMHNAAFKEAGINAKYMLFDIPPENPDELAHFCYETDLSHIGGFSVTMPYKGAIMDYMEHFDPLAKAVGSVNTVNIEDSKLIGYNTDSTGAIAALQEKTTPKGNNVLILGAGGAAKAIAYSLNEFDNEVFIFNRTVEKAIELAKELDIETIDYRDIKAGDFDIIINSTPVGMAPNTGETLLTADQIGKNAIVMDIITSPIETQLIKEAKKAGATVITGERMLLHQAVGQFEIWFGKKAPFEVMEKALYEEIERRK